MLTLSIPPLRERAEDIHPIARGILAGLECECPEADLALLTGYHWPGNIRQLKNFLRRAAVVGAGHLRGPLLKRLLEDEGRFHRALDGRGMGQLLTKGTLEEIEFEVIHQRIQSCGGNKCEAARRLGVAKSTLHDKLRRWKQRQFGSSLSANSLVTSLDYSRATLSKTGVPYSTSAPPGHLAFA